MLDKYPVPNKSLYAKEIGSKMIILNGAEIFEVNRMGTKLWKLFDGSKNIAVIIDIIKNEFDIDEKLAKKDILEFVQSLLVERFVILLDKPTDEKI
jgi:hypothetical protein